MCMQIFYVKCKFYAVMFDFAKNKVELRFYKEKFSEHINIV